MFQPQALGHARSQFNIDNWKLEPGMNSGRWQAAQSQVYYTDKNRLPDTRNKPTERLCLTSAAEDPLHLLILGFDHQMSWRTAESLGNISDVSSRQRWVWIETVLKRYCSPKNKYTVIIYSPSSRSKSVLFTWKTKADVQQNVGRISSSKWHKMNNHNIICEY